MSLPVSSSRSPCREESVSSEEAWLLQVMLPIQEALVHTAAGPGVVLTVLVILMTCWVSLAFSQLDCAAES